MRAASMDAPAVMWLVGAVLFCAGCWVGSMFRAVRPHRKPVGRMWVNDRKDIVGGRRG